MTADLLEAIGAPDPLPLVSRLRFPAAVDDAVAAESVHGAGR